jgi:microcompartment protein CcmL/EutN
MLKYCSILFLLVLLISSRVQGNVAGIRSADPVGCTHRLKDSIVNKIPFICSGVIKNGNCVVILRGENCDLLKRAMETAIAFFRNLNSFLTDKIL